MPANATWRRLPLPGLIGATLGVLFAVVAQFPNITPAVFKLISLLCLPGLVLLAPIFLLSGGPHGFLEVLIALVPLANGLGYWLVALLVLQIRACITAWPQRSQAHRIQLLDLGRSTPGQFTRQ